MHITDSITITHVFTVSICTMYVPVCRVLCVTASVLTSALISPTPFKICNNKVVITGHHECKSCLIMLQRIFKCNNDRGSNIGGIPHTVVLDCGIAG